MEKCVRHTNLNSGECISLLHALTFPGIGAGGGCVACQGLTSGWEWESSKFLEGTAWL